ncbi:hypothetical protein GGX14DRAFT_417157 [Mycena pura]|uniref:Uncharacterized protein n=1 Tax=Mycena pura TaxID=153505 RepID=A0AAD6YQK2_9AGAR|nr:hypothetical protein GGX14DRAFT_417157 [Mycena pura]
MQSNGVFITSILASASLAMSATITGWDGANCSGTQGQRFSVSSEECFTLGGGSTKAISYSDVPGQIQFYKSGGDHDACTNGAFLIRIGGSDCATAPDGFNWESVAVF